MKWMMVVMLVAGLSGCNWLDETRISGAGAVIERQQPLGERVTRVLAGVPATLYLVAGEQRGILIKGQANLLPYLELTERGSKLEIEVKDGYRLRPTEPLEITITLPELSEMALAGTGNGDLRGFKGEALELSVAGTGGIVASQLEVQRLKGNIAGAGSLDLGSGSAASIELNIAGAGDVLGSEMRGNEVEVNIAGSGDVEVRAQQMLKIGIAGTGNITYWGDPKVVQKIVGSGGVKRAGS
ncbi:head GIN domain-containing protein [Aeromonas allosaccharophila]|uniref:head GIN domain-containing protein n=1 Tax=Aeromonas allosaccharophila TaxID=656 RepID=UPI002AE05B9C|nr:head GIN domain-containing protein [Aeromonas allosaccharophila]